MGMVEGRKKEGKDSRRGASGFNEVEFSFYFLLFLAILQMRQEYWRKDKEEKNREENSQMQEFQIVSAFYNLFYFLSSFLCNDTLLQLF